MTRSLQSRVLALAGIGVFAASAALSMLSRQSLLAIEASAAREQARAASVAARAVGRDVLADFEALQGAVSAPGIQEPAVDLRARESALSVALQRFRLADAACFTDQAGVAELCTPAEARTRFLDATMIGTARDAIGNRRPLLSPFAGARDTREAVLVVPLSDGSGAAMGIVDANGSRLAALLPRGEGTALSSPGAGLPEDAEVRRSQARVEGTPWVVTMVEPASGEIAAFRRRSLWLGPSLTLLAVLLAWGVVLSVQRPVRTLTDAAERIAAGDLSRPIAGGNDEIGRLAAALEHMRARLRRSIESVEQANAVLEQRVRERTAQLMRVLRTVISAQEDERRRVARELHDETSQLVAAMAISLDAGMPSPPPPWLADVRRLVDRMHDGLHRVIVNLRPSVLDDLGLAAAIEWLAEHQLRHAGIMARCELSELQECRADTATEIALFRVVQEAVTNIVRHADASSVLIQAGLTESASGRPDSRLWIEIEDDGCGFEPASVSADAETLRGVGLLGMHERMELIGGTLQIDSAPGEGTRIRVEAPVHIGEEVFA
jgi:signal transduction histidine kinase